MYFMVGLEVVYGLAEYQSPKVLAQELEDIENVNK